MIDLGDHFRTVDGKSHAEWLRRQWLFARNRKEQDRQEQRADQSNDEIIDYAVSVVMATEVQIRRVETRLDGYDTATVAALLGNQEQMDAVGGRIATMLAAAFVMGDGRRVFLAEDRSQAYDEFGVPVGQDELDYDSIEGSRPSWEAFSSDLALRQGLEQERSQLLKFQQRVDAARETISDDGLSEDELKALDNDLLRLKRASVKERLPGQLQRQVRGRDLSLPETSVSSANPSLLPPMQ